MINLIRNELTKIGKKKSIYIVILLTIGYMVFSNFMYYKNSEYSYSYYSDGYVSYLEEELAKLDPSKESDVTMYLDLKTQLEIAKLSEQYEEGSWQTNVIQNNAVEYIGELVRYETLGITQDQEYQEVKQNYEEFLEKLQEDDWKYFVNKELDTVETQIAEIEESKNKTVDKSLLHQYESTLQDLTLQEKILQWRLEKNISYANSEENNRLNQYATYARQVNEQAQIEGKNHTQQKEYQELVANMKLCEYDIIHNTNTQSTDNAKGQLAYVFSNYEVFLLILVIMVAGVMISEEFNKGTIKLLLVKPYSRTKILLAKLITCFIILVLASIVLIALQGIIGGFIWGWDSYADSVTVYDFNINQVKEISIIPYVFTILLARMPMYVLLITLSMAISTIILNTALAVILPFLGYFAGTILNQLSLIYNLQFMKFFVPLNWNLETYLYGGLGEMQGMSMVFSIVICLLYFLLMTVVMTIVFKKKNIKNI